MNSKVVFYLTAQSNNGSRHREFAASRVRRAHHGAHGAPYNTATEFWINHV
jgi:hypothetical protein